MMELKNCPFCGSNVYFADVGRDDYIYILCDNDDCMADMGPHNSKAEAIKAWNTRTDGWISVEDRLPEPGNYLVVWNSLASQKYSNLCSKFDVLYWTGLSWGAPVNEKQPVLFWMPLPKAPDTKEEE